MKRLICLIISVLLVLGSLPMAAIAEDKEEKSLLKKTAEWVDGKKEDLKINLESEDATGRLNGKVLFLGSLCGNHTLTDGNIKTAIGVSAMYADVDYYLFQTKKDTFVPEKSFSGTIKKTKKTTAKESIEEVSKNDLFKNDLLAGSMHHTGYDFAKVLKELKSDSYDYIIMEFDGFLLTEYDPGRSPYTVPDDQTALLDAAAPVIKEYYAKDRVIWIVPPVGSSGTNMYYDNKFDSTGNTTASVREIVKLLAPEDLDSNGKVKTGKLNTQTALYGRITEKSADKKIWATYGSADDIQELLERKFGGIRYKRVVIKDTVNDGFIVDGVKGYIYNEETEKWADAGTKFSTTWKAGDKEITGTFTVSALPHTLVKMVIDAHVDEQNDPFKSAPNHIVDTNKGDAVAEYYNTDDGTPRDVYKAPTPQLQRFDCAITTKVINGTMTYKTNSETPVTLKPEDKVVVKDHSGLVNENDVLFSYTPNQYYEIDYIKIDGTELTSEELKTHGSSYEFADVDEDHTIEVAFKAQQVTVDFDTNGATSTTPEQQKINKGTTPTKPADPVKPGYTFNKWEKQDGSEFHFTDPNKDIVTENITLYADYTENDVTVTYVAEEGGKIKIGASSAAASDSETVKAATGTLKGATPVPNTGYTFDRWETVKGPEHSSDNVDPDTYKLTPPKNKDSVYENGAEYHAYFTQNKYTVQYENYGLGTKPQNETVGYGDKVANKPGDLTEEGYSFKGWYKDSNYSEKFDFDSDTITGPTTIYAKWGSTVAYVAALNNEVSKKGGTVSRDADIIDDVRDADVKGSVATEKTGYDFKGWSTSLGGDIISTDVNFVPTVTETGGTDYYKSVTFYANFVPEKRKVEFINYGLGTKPQTQTVDYDTKATNPGNLTATGYQFDGWYTDETFTTPFNFDSTIKTDCKAYAKWLVTINYVSANTEKGTVTKDSETINALKGTPVGSTAQENTGYNFTKWTVGSATGTKVGDSKAFKPTKSDTGGTDLFKPATFYANFASNIYTVTFNKKGHGVEEAPQQQVEYKGKATSVTLTEPGYTFGGWFKDNSCTESYDFNTPVEKSFTLFAKWSKTPIVITYKVKEGEGTVGGKQTDAHTVNAIDGDPNGCTAAAATGYHFVKWADKNGHTLTTENLKYVPKPNEISNLYEEATYYAYFEKNTYKVNFEKNGHGDQNVPQQQVKYKEKATNPGNLTEKGYTFDGWYKDSLLTQKFDFNTEITQDTTVYAKWSKTPITITYTVKVGEGTVGGKQTDTHIVNAIDGDPTGCTAIPAEHSYFSCWLDKDGNEVGLNELYVPSKNADGIYESATYYACFIPEQNLVIFDLNGHSPEIENQKVDYGKKATRPADPTDTGFIFKDWYTDRTYSTPFDFNTPIIKDTVVYSKWDVIVEYVDPTGPKTPSQNENIPEGEKVNPPQNITEGYENGGLFLDPEYKIPFDPNVPITEPTKIYTKWIEKTAPLHYDLNGGTSSAPINDETMFYSKNTDVTKTEPTKENKVFKGWATSKEKAEKLTVDYKAGSLLKGKNTVPEETTLYAVWADVESPKTSDYLNNSFWAFIAILSLAAVGCGAAIFFKKKENE